MQPLSSTLEALQRQAMMAYSTAPYTVQKNDVRYWVISDTHRGHTKLSREGLAHKRRPADVDDRVDHNWRSLVRPQDIVLHLGDVAFGFVNLKGWLDSLPGTKILVRGNHDPKSISWYCRNGFSWACDGLVLGGVYYSHQPAKHLPEGAKINVHGHCHNRWPRGLRRYPHCRLFALEYENYMPRIISKFLSSIEKEVPYRLGVKDRARDIVLKIKSWRKDLERKTV